MMMKSASRVQAAGGRAASKAPAVVPTLSRALPVRRRSVAAMAASSAPKDGMLAFSAAIGLPTNEGVFGFRPFAETWCGRLAMMGFITSIVEEFITGQGTLAQIGLMQAGQPNFVVLALLLSVFGGATIFASVDTLNRIRGKKMSARDIARYKNFLALNKEEAAAAAAAAMKAKGDFTSLGNDMAAVSAAKAAGTPVDAFLSTNEVAEGAAAAQEMKQGSPSQPPATRDADVEETMLFGANSEMAYALDVEVTNGRWAMLGFLAAILVEAGTGNGIIMQLIMWFKITGFLGADSGF